MSRSFDVSTLPSHWTEPRTCARIHLLPARQSPRVVVLRRQPSKVYHVMTWNTRNDAIEHGSWFRGRLYEARCDVSWDGAWMVYLAMGRSGDTWNGICRPPWLKTRVDVPNCGTWAGGGVFVERRRLLANDHWHWNRSLSEFSGKGGLPFMIEHLESGGETFPILSYRLERDGWKRNGPPEPTGEIMITLPHKTYANVCPDDPGWELRPSPAHPTLFMYFRGYLVGGYTFEFELEGSNLLGPEVDWATWSCNGDLLVARRGAIERYTLEALRRGEPTFRLDLEALTPPWEQSAAP